MKLYVMELENSLKVLRGDVDIRSHDYVICLSVSVCLPGVLVFNDPNI